MEGEFVADDLEMGEHWEEVAAKAITREWGMEFGNNPPAHEGDRRTKDRKWTFEFKVDRYLGVSPNFMLELKAREDWAGEEIGWIYRYENVNFFGYVNYETSILWMFDWKPLRKFIHANLWKLDKVPGWITRHGVVGNPHCLIGLIPTREVEQFVISKLDLFST